jgi:two-component system, chemotaxis family, CheB/CheR fusion protein
LLSEKGGQIISDKNFPVIEGEPLHITQLFHNLIGNAIKFSRENIPLKVTLSWRILPDNETSRFKALEGPGPFIEIICADNGIGFNEEFADQMFVIFQRLNEKKKYPGTGIGLALCRRIVNNHRGHIYAKSLDEGAAFHVILPLKQGKKKPLN